MFHHCHCVHLHYHVYYVLSEATLLSIDVHIKAFVDPGYIVFSIVNPGTITNVILSSHVANMIRIVRTTRFIPINLVILRVLRIIANAAITAYSPCHHGHDYHHH